MTTANKTLFFGEIPQNYHTFPWFDSPEMYKFMIPTFWGNFFFWWSLGLRSGQEKTQRKASGDRAYRVIEFHLYMEIPKKKKSNSWAMLEWSFISPRSYDNLPSYHMKGGYSVAQMIMGWCFDDFNENNIFYHLSQPFKYQCSFQESCARSSPVPSDLLSTMQSGSNLCRTMTSFRIHPKRKGQIELANNGGHQSSQKS